MSRAPVLCSGASNPPAVAGAVTSYGYDSQQRVTSVVEKNGTATNASWAYTYDKDGNRLSQTITGKAGGAGTNTNLPPGTRTFGYNGADELTSANGSTAGYSYDANGDETANPSWEAGNTLGRTDVKTTSTGDVISLTRTDTGQVFNFTDEQALPTGPRQLTWAHDVTYTWNPVGLESYTSATGLGQVSLFTLPNGQTLGYQVNGKMEYFHRDRLGSVVAMSGDAGTKEAYYRYDPYGQPRDYYRWSPEAKANALMYVGAPRDTATGLVRLGARWYDPTMGRFTTADPSGQEVNPYLYASGNPVCKVDPTGLDAACAEGVFKTGLAFSGVVLSVLDAPETFGVSLLAYTTATSAFYYEFAHTADDCS